MWDGILLTIHSQRIVSQKVVVRESGEIMFEKVFVSPRPPPTSSFKVNWIKEFDSEVAGGSESSQQTQPKTRNPIIKNG